MSNKCIAESNELFSIREHNHYDSFRYSLSDGYAEHWPAVLAICSECILLFGAYTGELMGELLRTHDRIQAIDDKELHISFPTFQ